MNKTILFYKIKVNKVPIVGLIATILLTSVFAVFLSSKSMPVAEGWYDYYATQILDGQIVYEDFEYLFAPAYIYFMTLFVKIFGTGIWGMRLLGVVMFVSIAIILYLIMIRLFSPTASFLAAVTAVFYLQSEVYSVFYDYVRLMDIMAYLAVLFMTCTMLRWIKHQKATVYLILWGIFSACFILVKQNMGLLFTAFSILFLIASLFYLQENIKGIMKKTGIYLISLAVPIIITIIIIGWISNINTFFQSVLFGAAEAKGGLLTVLFRWIVIGKDSFLLYLLGAIVAVMILVINYRISIYQAHVAPKRKLILLAVVFGIFFICVIAILHNRKLGEYFATLRALDPYLLFLITFILMLILIFIFIGGLLKKETKYAKYLPILGILGAFFSISYGAGTSGGLSIGESALGISVLICLFFDSIKGYLQICLKFLIILLCIYISMRNIAYKLVYPCQWWGINSGSIYDCTESTNIPGLKNIKVTASEKNFYESIVNVINENTSSEDTIYCFPCISIFYCLSDRNDPGVSAKVQWFDVSTNETVINDIDVIKNNPPKVILLYNLNESTYDGHESAFNSGDVSGTRIMRDFLYEFVYTNDYKYIDNYVSDNNNISVFVYDESDFTETLMGNGTKEDPYLINTTEELVNWSMYINQDKASEDDYFCINADIDLNEVIWIPAGYYQSGTEIRIDLNNHNILNLNTNPDRYNLGNTLFIS